MNDDFVVSGEVIPTVHRFSTMRGLGDSAPDLALAAGAEGVLSGSGLQKISALVRLDRTIVPQIPQIGAVKDFQPDEGNFLQHKLLENTLKLRHEALTWPLWSQAKTQLEGTWDDERNLVFVLDCHSALQFFGTAAPGRGFVLQAEEALFLLESGVLRILSTCHQEREDPIQSVPWSLEEAYLAFMDHPTHPLSLEHYKVFSRLARAGYVVVPHQSTDFTVYERLIGLDRFTSKKNAKKGPLEGDSVAVFSQSSQIDNCDDQEASVAVGGDDDDDDDDDMDESLDDSNVQRRLWMSSSNSWMSATSPSTEAATTTTTTAITTTTTSESTSKSNEKTMSGTHCDVNSDLLSISLELMDREEEDEVEVVSPSNWVEEDLSFPNLVHDCTTWPTFDRRKPTHVVNASAQLKQFKRRYLPFEVPEVMAAKSLWAWNSSSSSERWIRDVKLDKMKIPLKRRRKRQWLPWTPDEALETVAAAMTGAATTAETDLDQRDVWGNIEAQTWFSISEDFKADLMKTSKNWSEFKSRLASPPTSQNPEERFPHLWDHRSPSPSPPTKATTSSGQSTDVESTSSSVYQTTSSSSSSSSDLPTAAPALRSVASSKYIASSADSLSVSSASVTPLAHPRDVSSSVSSTFVTPLVHPRDVSSSDDIFRLLDIIKPLDNDEETRKTDDDENAAMTTSESNAEVDSRKDMFQVVYHLYLANKTYSKSSRGAPAYRIFMRRKSPDEASSSSSSQPSLPSSGDLKLLFSTYRDGVPLLFASVEDDDSPSFFAYYDITLPAAPVHMDTS